MSLYEFVTDRLCPLVATAQEKHISLVVSKAKYVPNQGIMDGGCRPIHVAFLFTRIRISERGPQLVRTNVFQRVVKCNLNTGICYYLKSDRAR